MSEALFIRCIERWPVLSTLPQLNLLSRDVHLVQGAAVLAADALLFAYEFWNAWKVHPNRLLPRADNAISCVLAQRVWDGVSAARM